MGCWADADRYLIRDGGRFTPTAIERAAGSFVYDQDDRSILDFTSGQRSAILGHSLSSAGVIDLPVGYLAALKQKCLERGMLLILDEAQTGLCRTGHWYAFQRDGVIPDISTLSKTLGVGLPLVAVGTSAEIEQQDHEFGFLFYTTHVSDPLAAAVRVTVMDFLAEDLYRGWSWSTDRATKQTDDELGQAVTRACFELGLHLNVVQLPGTGGTFRIARPLTVSEVELDLGVEILDKALGRVVAGR